jgi:hypothetical protein
MHGQLRNEEMNEKATRTPDPQDMDVGLLIDSEGRQV